MNKIFIFCYLSLAFVIGCLVRLIPIILNFPYPVGYDTINYYLPNLYHFESNWIVLLLSFPVYIIIVYFFSYIFSTDIYYSFLASNVILYGFFSISIFSLSKIILNQSLNRSLIFTVFVIFQLGTLRISWDLYRNLFSLILFNLFLLLIYYCKQKNTLNNVSSLICFFSISLLTVFSDRLMGILLIIVSFICSIMYKQKYLFIINLFFTVSFLYYFLTFDKITFVSTNLNFLDVLLNPSHGKNDFSQFDISILFLSIYGILIPFFFRGFVFTEFKGKLLLVKIPLIITLFFSFTWIFIPNYGFLVPERWLLLSGIYISLIAIYGFFLLIDSILKQEILRKGMSLIFLFIFVVYGLLFIVMPSGVVFSFPSFFQQNTGFIFPFSMNFNSVKITDNSDLLNSIDWININTSNNSVIIGSKHWRGWFSLFLQSSHKYFFEDDVDINDTLSFKNQTQNIASLLEKKFSYLCKYKNNNEYSNYKNNSLFYFIDLNKGYNTTKYIAHYAPPVYITKSFVIYNLTSQICKD